MVHIYHKEETAENDAIRHGSNRQTQFDRVNKNNGAIYPKGFDLLIIDNEKADVTNVSATGQFDSIEIINPQNFGHEINRVFNKVGNDRYVIIVKGGTVFLESFVNDLKRFVLNPGTLLQLDIESLIGTLYKEETEITDAILLNNMSFSLKRAGFDRIALCNSIGDIIKLYPQNKRLIFDIDLYKESKRINKTNFVKGRRYVIYGAGKYGEMAFDQIKEIGAEAVCFIDSDTDKHGNTKYDLDVLAPEEIISKRSEWDQVVIAAIAYRDIRDKLYKLGLTYEDILAPVYVVGNGI